MATHSSICRKSFIKRRNCGGIIFSHRDHLVAVINAAFKIIS